LIDRWRYCYLEGKLGSHYIDFSGPKFNPL
jgi:hypothetical protein